MRNSGFTLIEMIAVLLILAILAAAMTAGLSIAREKAWRTQAREACRNVCVAWNTYLLDVRKFPKNVPKDGKEVKATYDNMKWIVDTDPNKYPNELPPSRIYLEISEKEKTDGLKDHWDQPIMFSLDMDYDGEVENPYPNAFDPALPKAKASSIAWSDGNPRRAKRDDNPIVIW
jgi:prepilin-type N-terminal cleavage/methylation domain-containing protein